MSIVVLGIVSVTKAVDILVYSACMNFQLLAYSYIGVYIVLCVLWIFVLLADTV